jgi:predicted RNA-binding Zn-ribbon protein involved in translation (DUF1610 family)
MASEKFKCKECGKEFKSNAGLGAHMSYVHGKLKKAKRGRPVKNRNAMRYCPNCGVKLPG